MTPRWTKPQRTPLDRENALERALCVSDERLATYTPEELARMTGCDVRLCEVRLLARRAAVARLKRGEVVW